MPRWRPERTLRLLLLVALLLPGPGGVLRAQVEEARIQAFVHGGLRLSSLVGQVGTLAGGGAVLSLAPGVFVGGAGWVLLNDRDLPGDGAFTSRAMGFGYGGALLEVAVADVRDDLGVVVRTLAGAGNVDIRDPATGIRIDSSNFVILEPEAALRLGLAGRVGLDVSLSYRATFGLDTLEGVDDGDISGAALSVILRLGPFS